MKKVENIVIAAVVIFLSAVIIMLWFGAIDDTKTQIAKKEQIDLAKQDIIAQYGFETVLWLSIEEVDNLDGRDDFYIFTCLTESDEMYLYRFAVTIREVNGEIDVDTWLIREGE